MKRISIALFALGMLAGCQTSNSTVSKETIAALSSFQSQPGTSVASMIAEFEKRCIPALETGDSSIEDAAKAAGLTTPGTLTPKTRKRAPKTFFFSPSEPSIAFIMPRGEGLKSSCQMIANSSTSVEDAMAFRKHYEAQASGKVIPMSDRGGVLLAQGVPVTIANKSRYIFVQERQAKHKAVVVNMYPANVFDKR